jgi:hypothetical protein
MFDVKFDRSGFDSAISGLLGMLNRPTEYMRQPAEEWLAETEREQFASEGRAGASGAWRQLAPSTLRERALERRGFKILDRTGAMRNQLTDAGSLRQFVEVTDDQIVFHLPPPAAYHQGGTVRMPQRKVVDPSDAQLQRLGDVLRREAVTSIERLGLNVE